MKAYSMDLRERVVRVCDEGLDTQEEIAQALGVGISFITELLRRRRDATRRPSPPNHAVAETNRRWAIRS